MSDQNIEVTEYAFVTIDHVHNYLEAIRIAYGEDHPSYVKTLASWVTASSRMWRLVRSGGRLCSEGDFSLGISGLGMYVGLVYFRDRSFDETSHYDEDKRYRVTWYCVRHKRYVTDQQSNCAAYLTDGDKFCFPQQVPVPGTWSLHS